MAWIIPLLSALGPVIGAGVQSIANRRNARIQNQYNEPQRQMERFRKAGLNPNLMYTQGNPGNMTPITPTNWQDAIGGAGQRYAQTELTQTQQDVGEQKITESQAKTAIHNVQEKILQNNPYLRPEYVNGVVNIMWNTAKQKQQETDFKLGPPQTGADTAGEATLQLELNRLMESNGLLRADNEIKAEILKSEKFKAELLEVQKNWLKNADITPQHIWQGILLLLTKMAL